MFRLVPFTLSILTQWRRKKFPKSGESLVCDCTNRPVKLFSTENAVSSCPRVIRLKQRFIASEEIETNRTVSIKIKTIDYYITFPKSHNFSLHQYCMYPISLIGLGSYKKKKKKIEYCFEYIWDHYGSVWTTMVST